MIEKLLCWLGQHPGFGNVSKLAHAPVVQYRCTECNDVLYILYHGFKYTYPEQLHEEWNSAFLSLTVCESFFK